MLGGGKVGWLLWRCKEELEGVTVVRKCDSPKEVCQLLGRCNGHGKKEKGLRRLSLGRKCNSHQWRC